MPDDPVDLKSGQIELAASLSWVSTFNHSDPDYIVDSEMLRLGLGGWYAVNDKWQIGVELPIYSVSGGTMDGLIDNFHKLLGIGDGSRDKASDNDLSITMDGQTYDLDSEYLLGNMSVGVRYAILAGDFGLSVGTKLQLPTATDNSWTDHDSIGFGFDVIVYYRYRDWYLYSGLGVAHTGEGTILNRELDPLRVIMLIAIEYEFMDDLSAIFEVYSHSGPLVDLDEYSQWSTMINLGIRLQISKGLAFEAGCIENVVTYDNSVDFGAHVGLVYRY